MRSVLRRTVLTAVAAGLALGLVACSGGTGSSASGSASATAGASPSRSVSDPDALAAVKVSGAVGKAATITLPWRPFSLTAATARLVDDGTGAALVDGQVMLVHLGAVSGTNGSTVGATYGSSPEGFTVGATTVGPLDKALAGAHVGARVLLGLVASGATSVYAIDVVDAYDVPSRAQGTAVAPVAGLPTVTLDGTGVPTLAAASGAAPTSLVAQDLITGTGAAVQSGQVVTVQYSGWLWDGTAFDSSWAKGTPFTFTVGAGSVITGWDTGLVGKTVGSQVLLVVPPDQGYGSTAQGKVPANSTLVFVVDVLAAKTASSS